MSIISVCFIIISYFITRTLKEIDINQQNLAKDMRVIEINFAKLEGEHRVLSKSHCADDGC